MNPMRKFFRPTLKKLSLLLILVGVGIIMYVPATWLWSWYDRRGLDNDFDHKTVPTVPFGDVSEAEKLKQLALEFRKELKPEETIARLEIPKIGINAIVVEGTQEGSLRKGPGHVENTPIPGMQLNVSIAGDRVLYGGPFLNLDELENGDEVHLTTTYGIFDYVISSKSFTTPEDVTVLDFGKQEAITLITCDPPWDTARRMVLKGNATSAKLKPPQ